MIERILGKDPVPGRYLEQMNYAAEEQRLIACKIKDFESLDLKSTLGMLHDELIVFVAEGEEEQVTHFVDSLGVPACLRH